MKRSKHTGMDSKYVSFDVNVSLMRIIACMIVIGCHIRLPVINNNIVDKSRLFIDGFFDDGVAIFFCITGFFIFNNINYKKLWKKIITNILIPAFLTECVSAMLGGYLAGSNIIESITNPVASRWLLLRDFLSFEYVNGGITGH